jgi:hypothetical protein
MHYLLRPRKSMTLFWTTFARLGSRIKTPILHKTCQTDEAAQAHKQPAADVCCFCSGDTMIRGGRALKELLT